MTSIGEPGVTVGDLRVAIERIEKEADDVKDPLLLVTGDLTAEGLREEYEGTASVLLDVEIPSVFVPGNHDERNYGLAPL